MELKLSPRSLRKREQIIDAAGELFTSHGYFETSMDQIAAAAEVSKQTVYAHFGSKDELFTHCIEQRCSEVSVTPPQICAGEDPNKQMVEYCLQLSEMMQSEPALYVLRLCVSQAETHPQLSQRFFAAGPRCLADQLAAWLTALDGQHGWQFTDPHSAAEQLMVLIKGMVGLRLELGLQGETESQRRQRIEQAVLLFSRGYRQQDGTF
ncbi:TetR/AcrR family transcriptional regulator [Ferrimonas senticii]|uniref:TetR/AcrR family transcriptional regulator n=1 Tax=Ferrimonas senticii TaxID=394566 RepID=UPI0003F4EDF3|nr:TetR/AcrR family transcriptional regulator [Ferrimonas senticii]